MQYTAYDTRRVVKKEGTVLRNLGLQVLLFLLLPGILSASILPGVPTPTTGSAQPLMVASFDPDDPPATRSTLTPFLSFGGQLELTYEFKHNADLDANLADDNSCFKPELSLALTFHPNRYLQAFVDITLTGEYTLLDRQQDEHELRFEFKEAFVLIKNLWDKRVALQIGRQRFDDDREWLYDEELDAARVLFTVAALTLELSVSRERLLDKDFLNKDRIAPINNYIAYGNYKIADVDFVAYVMFRDDRSAKKKKEDLWFLGLRTEGDLTENIEYWLELAHVRGQNGATQVRGFGVDLGGMYKFALPFEPSMIFVYAFGTGDSNPADNTNHNFRQTGLHDNKSEFNGVTDFKYYGELFAPELSNLSIFTAGVGFKPSYKSSVDLLYHYYLQHKASEDLRDVGLGATPDGHSKRLGSEIDLILGYEEISNVDLALAFGYFIPGKAFPAKSDHSLFIRLEMQLAF